MNPVYRPQVFDETAKDIADWAEKKGFWTPPISADVLCQLGPTEKKALENLQKSTKLMLIVSELGEVLEGLRKEVPSKIEGFTNEEEEIADTMIRLLDYCGHYKLNIGAAVAAKMAVNEGRPYRHGKAF